MKKIDELKTFEEISKWRQFDHKRLVASGDNLEGPLVRIYKEPTHFIYELLQNADDAGAVKVSFELSEDELIVSHDGAKDFSLKDIISITGIGNSTKKNDSSIGKFGMGFKSVFAITKVPYIYNRAYNFRIENLTVPLKESAIDLGEYTTIIKLPFSSDTHSNQEIYSRISEELEDFQCSTIMFLRNVCSVFIKYGDNKRKIQLDRQNVTTPQNEIIRYQIRDTDSDKVFFVFKNLQSNVSIAYHYHNGKIQALKQEVFISSYLPTKVLSGLSFYIDAPFQLSSSRELFDDRSSINQAVFKQIAHLFEQTLLILNKEGLITASFLNDVLPLDSGKGEYYALYRSLYQACTNILQEQQLLPTVDNRYATSNRAILYERSVMAQLMPNYRQSKSWLKIDNNYARIRSFLKRVLDVEEVSNIDFIKTVAPKLNNQFDDWLYRFYELCAKNYFYDLRGLPIIKTRAGNFAPADQVFKYSKGLSDDRIIDKLFTTESKDISDSTKQAMQELLDELGIKERGLVRQIEMDILSEWASADDHRKKQLFLEICQKYESASKSDQRDIVDILRDKKILLTNKSNWCYGSDLMIGNEDQRLVFPEAEFLDETYRCSYLCEKLCRELGVIEGLSVQVRYAAWSSYNARIDENVAKRYVRQSKTYIKLWYIKSHYIEDFEKSICNFNGSDQTLAVVKLIDCTPDAYFKDQVGFALPRGDAKKDECDIPSKFMIELQESNWIIIDGKKYSPGEITKEYFVEKLGLNGGEKIINNLEFLPSAVESLPPEEREMIELYRGLPEEKREAAKEFFTNMKLQYNNKANENLIELESDNTESLDDEYFPSEITEDKTYDPLEIRFNPDEIDTRSMMQINGNIFDGRKEFTQASAPVETVFSDEHRVRSISEKHRLDIKAQGDKAEKKIYEHLINKKYKDSDGYRVRWLGGNNEGYDIDVAKDGEKIAWIEVKSYRSSNGRRFKITDKEWKYARKYRDKYTIYAVDVDAGDWRELTNPFQLYMDGGIDVELSESFINMGQ